MDQAIVTYDIADEQLEGEVQRRMYEVSFTLFLAANEKLTTILRSLYRQRAEPQ